MWRPSSSWVDHKPALLVSSYFDANPRGLKLNCTLSSLGVEVNLNLAAAVFPNRTSFFTIPASGARSSADHARPATWQLVVLVPRSTETHVAKPMAISRNVFHFTQNIEVRQQWRWACNHMYTRLYQAPCQLCLTTSLLATDGISHEGPRFFTLVQPWRTSISPAMKRGWWFIYDQEPGVDRGFMPAQRSGKCVCDVTKLYKWRRMLGSSSDNNLPRTLMNEKLSFCKSERSSNLIECPNVLPISTLVSVQHH